MKFAFVTPRYGADISAGAEHACRLIAEHVCERHDVDVLTTCARDHRTWKNEYSEGADRVRGVLVRRFGVSQVPDHIGFDALSQRLQTSPHSRAEELEWVRLHGPWSPGLIDYLKRANRSYDVLVFFGLWHPLTVHGLEVAPERSVLFPYLQLQPALRFGLWPDVVRSARGRRVLLRGRASSAAFVSRRPPCVRGGRRHRHGPAAAAGVSAAPAGSARRDCRRGRAGRRGRSGSDRTISTAAAFRSSGAIASTAVSRYTAAESSRTTAARRCSSTSTRSRPSDDDAALVLMGVKMMKVPEEPYLRLAGVIPDRERMTAYEAADVTIAPASDDLLAQPLLESLAVGTPVLASARNAAAVEHCRRAGAGLYYANREEFVGALTLLTSNAQLRERLGANGRAYIRSHHRWDGVLGRFDRLISRARRASRRD